MSNKPNRVSMEVEGSNSAYATKRGINRAHPVKRIFNTVMSRNFRVGRIRLFHESQLSVKSTNLIKFQ